MEGENVYTSSGVAGGFGKREVLKSENCQQTNVVKVSQLDIEKFQEKSADEKLFAYIRTLKDIHVLEEKQSRAIQYLQKKIQDCNKIINIGYKPAVRIEKRPTIKDAIVSLGLEAFFGWIFGAYTGSLLVLLFIYMLIDLEIKGTLSALTAVALFPALLIMIAIVSFVVWCYHEENIRIYNRRVIEINRQAEQNLADNRKLDARKEHATTLKRLYNLEINKIKLDLSSTRILLNQMYSKNIIYSKYRNNLIYICSIYEYFDSKRCTSLEGPHGAYNLLENDIKFGLVVDKLDIIIHKLDSIIENQKILYDAILECNVSIRNLENSISGLERTIKISNAGIEDKLDGIAFNTEMTRRYTYLSAQCELYRTWKYY